MHDKARLVTPFPALMREVGELIAIEDIENHFLDSQSAKKLCMSRIVMPRAYMATIL
jgi:hypothetical protein